MPVDLKAIMCFLHNSYMQLHDISLQPHCVHIDPMAEKIAQQTGDVAKDIEDLVIYYTIGLLSAKMQL